MISRFYRGYRDEDQTPWPLIMALSLLLHGIVFLGIWGMDRYSRSRQHRPNAITVRLVSPSPNVVHAASQSTPQKKTPAVANSKKAKVNRPVPQIKRKLVSIRPRDAKPPVRKVTKPKIIEQSTPPPPAPPKVETTERPALSAATASPPGGKGRVMTAEEARYIDILKQRIWDNWRAYLPPEEGVLGTVRIQISGKGQIEEFTFIKGSGMAHVDASITRALKKSVLPPPPASLADNPLLIRFWPSGS